MFKNNIIKLIISLKKKIKDLENYLECTDSNLISLEKVVASQLVHPQIYEFDTYGDIHVIYHGLNKYNVNVIVLQKDFYPYEVKTPKRIIIDDYNSIRVEMESYGNYLIFVS